MAVFGKKERLWTWEVGDRQKPCYKLRLIRGFDRGSSQERPLVIREIDQQQEGHVTAVHGAASVASQTDECACLAVSRGVVRLLDKEETINGKYELLGVISSGPVVDVWIAIARGPHGFSKLVVIKAVRAEFAEDEAVCKAFAEEVRIVGPMSHANIVHIIESSVYQGRPMLVIEYVDGQSLGGMMDACARAGKSLPWNIGVRIVQEVLQGLMYAHTPRHYNGAPLRLVHGQINPYSILINYQGEVKITEFGFAGAERVSRDGDVSRTPQKLAYMAPEQISGAAVDHRADIYSSGVVLWQVLTGRVWWQDKEPDKVLFEALHGIVPPPSQVRQDIPLALEQVCTKALQLDPGDRYQSAAQMHDALEAAIAALAPASLREVGAFVSELFAEPRAHLARAVERRLKSAGNHAADEPARAKLAPAASQEDSMDGSLRRWPLSEGQYKKLLCVVVFSLFVGLSTLAVLRFQSPFVGEDPGHPSRALGSGLPTPWGRIPAGVHDIGEPVSREPTVAFIDDCTLAVRVVPSQGQVLLGERLLDGNPTEVRLARDGRTHVVRGRARGYAERQATITATGDMSVVLELHRLDAYSNRRPGQTAVAPHLATPADTSPRTDAQSPVEPLRSRGTWDAASSAPVPTKDAETARERLRNMDLSNPW